jgi:Na+/serine symporter
MLRLHFEQVHRMAVNGTLLARSHFLLDQVAVLCVQKIASRSGVMDETIKFVTGVCQPIVVWGKLGKRHLGMVFVAKRADAIYGYCTRHEVASSKHLNEARVNT